MSCLTSPRAADRSDDRSYKRHRQRRPYEVISPVLVRELKSAARRGDRVGHEIERFESRTPRAALPGSRRSARAAASPARRCAGAATNVAHILHRSCDRQPLFRDTARLRVAAWPATARSRLVRSRGSRSFQVPRLDDRCAYARPTTPALHELLTASRQTRLRRPGRPTKEVRWQLRSSNMVDCASSTTAKRDWVAASTAATAAYRHPTGSRAFGDIAKPPRGNGQACPAMQAPYVRPPHGLGPRAPARPVRWTAAFERGSSRLKAFRPWTGTMRPPDVPLKPGRTQGRQTVRVLGGRGLKDPFSGRGAVVDGQSLARAHHAGRDGAVLARAAELQN